MNLPLGAQRGWQLLAVLWIALLVVACQPASTTSTPSTDNSTTSSSSTANDTSTASATNATAIEIEAIAPLALDKARQPVLLQIPALDVEIAVEPMGWLVSGSAAERTTKWVIPAAAAGWHVNSAGAGGAGNLILTGHQAVGEAVFAPLALGEIVIGQQILLTAEDGTIYVYEVNEVSEPIPMIGATADDQAAATAFIKSSDDAILTLITGWPDFSTTHRIFAVANFLGKVAEE